jgi:hypothetical protein
MVFLFRRNYDGVLLRCLEKQDADKVLKELHDGLTGGNFAGETTTHKILRVGYYWPTVFKDAHAYSRAVIFSINLLEERVGLLFLSNL